MMINIHHVIFCDKAMRDPSTGKLTCQGIFEHVHTERFPITLDFSIVAWASGINNENNDFTLTIRDKTGKVCGIRNNYNVSFHHFAGREEIVLHFNKFVFTSPQDFYTVEIAHKGQTLTKKVLRPFNPSMIKVGPPDRGFIDL